MQNKLQNFLLAVVILVVSLAIALVTLPSEGLRSISFADWLSLLVAFICILISAYCFMNANNMPLSNNE
jgi:hypothetical protein